MAREFTDAEREAIREIGRRTRREQGLPPKVIDETTLAQVAALVGPWLAEHAGRGAA